MSGLDVFRLKVGLCLPILLTSVILKLSDFSPFWQLTWKRSSYSTSQLIYPGFHLDFFHNLPSIIVGLYFNLLTLDSI